MAMKFMSLTFHEQSLLLWLSDFDPIQLRNCRYCRRIDVRYQPFEAIKLLVGRFIAA